MTQGIRGSGTKLGTSCPDCGIILDIDNHIAKNGYIQKRCKECFLVWSNKQPSRQKKARQETYIAWKFGISIEEYNRRLKLQLGGCAICKQPCKTGRNLAIDHDHKTGRIRDLLCYRCNAVLGLVNEDEELLFALIEYLKIYDNIEEIS